MISSCRWRIGINPRRTGTRGIPSSERKGRKEVVIPSEARDLVCVSGGMSRVGGTATGTAIVTAEDAEDAKDCFGNHLEAEEARASSRAKRGILCDCSRGLASHDDLTARSGIKDEG